MKTEICKSNVTTRIKNGVVVCAVHPQLGPLYWEVIQGGKAGGTVTCSITDELDAALVLEADWRTTDRDGQGDHMKRVERDLVTEYRVLEFDGWYDEVEYEGSLTDLEMCSGQSGAEFLKWLQTANWVDVPGPNTAEQSAIPGDAIAREAPVSQEVHEITIWEHGRLAATRGVSSSENPYAHDTRPHDEWRRGFMHGYGFLKEQTVVAGKSVVTPKPVMAVEYFPDHSVWAAANRMQMKLGLREDELAARFGVSRERLRAEMIRHNYWDDDAIPMGIREAS